MTVVKLNQNSQLMQMISLFDKNSKFILESALKHGSLELNDRIQKELNGGAVAPAALAASTEDRLQSCGNTFKKAG
ncbi:MAG: hypothetical protein LBP30_06195 [Clostridiales Family XIII bacterium]|jgi:hypothetical protein|nr:hypothetical protein [Clostridiales Family XIII bacterium]